MKLGSSGIYSITNLCNGKYYIGSAINLSGRKSKHFSDLLKNKHENTHLQRSFNKYGAQSFSFSVLEYVENTEQLIYREQHWIDMAKCEEGKLYNQRKVAESNLGLHYPHTEATKKKISESMRLLKKTPEHLAKISAALRGKHATPEARRKQRLAKLGKSWKMINGKRTWQN